MGHAPPAAIVLAAGRGTRLPSENKLLALINGEPVVLRAVREVVRAALAQVVVVTGFDAAAVRAALAGLPVQFAHNADFASGLASSLRVGLAALDAEASGALICLGDMPLLRARHFRALVAAFEAHQGQRVCAPSFEGRRGNPVLWPRRYFGELDALRGDRGGRELLERLGAEVQLVPIDDPAVTLDVDTEEALAALRRRAGADDSRG